MMDTLTSSASLPPGAVQHIDRLCTQFENAWKSGARPRIEDFLDKALDGERLLLLQELILLDIDYHKARGEPGIATLQAADYQRRFPELQPAWLTEVLAPEPCATDVAAAKHSEKILGPYRLLEPIGEGGFGIVFLAEQQEPVRRQVAVKLLKPGMDSRQIIARFEAERQALALMDHPNIARVLDAGTTASGRPYFVMDLVRGLPITDFCDQQQLTTEERLRLFVNVCQAVQHAHQKGIIHRDIKPSNVLVTRQDGTATVKVIDFGIAKALGQQLTDKTLFTAFAQMVGTPLYMSPEQAGLSGVDIDTRSDIYALGVVLYELLTGTTPFDKERLHEAGYDEMRRIIREEEPPRPSTRLSTLGQAASTMSAQRQSDPRRLSHLFRGELDWIVMRCLEKDRERRYESASALAADIERYLRNEPVAACPPTTWYRCRKFVRRNKVPVLAAAVVALALSGGLLVAGIGMVQAQAAARVAEENLERAKIAEALTRKQLEEISRQKDLTAKEAAIARAVNQFLRDLLAHADIGNQPLLTDGTERNRNITVAELLDRASKQIEGEFTGQPLTEAAIRMTLGSTYRQLGRYPEARKHLERSLQLRIAQLGPNHADTLAGKEVLALLYQAQDRFAQAEALLKEVLDGRTSALGTDDASTRRARGEMATLYFHQGQLGPAETIYKAVIAAAIARQEGESPDILTNKHNLANLYLSRGKYDLAETLCKEVLAVLTTQHGPQHRDTLTCKNTLALVYLEKEQYGAAEALFHEVIDAMTAQLGPDEPATLSCKGNLAELYRSQGKYDRAEALFKEVIAGQTRQLGANDDLTLTTKHNLASLYLTQRKLEQAELLLKVVIDGRLAVLGAEHPSTLLSKNNLARVYLDQGKYGLAVPLSLAAVEGYGRIFDISHVNMQMMIGNLIECYEKTKRPAQAEPLLRKLAEFLRQRGADSPAYAGQLATLGLNLLQQKKGKDAETVLRSCLAIRAKIEPHEWRTFYAQSMLGMALTLQKKHEEAEPLLLGAYKGMKQCESQLPPQGRFRVTETLKRVVTLYETWNKKEKAAQWRAKLPAE